MKKPRKAPNNSTPALVKRAQTLQEVILNKVPVGFDLSEAELATFTSYAQTRQEWTPAELHLLARLAQAECEIQQQTALIREEGDITQLSNGVVMPNPRYKIIAQTERTLIQLVGKLHITITSNDAGSRNSTSRGMRPVRAGAQLSIGPIDWTKVKP